MQRRASLYLPQGGRFLITKRFCSSSSPQEWLKFELGGTKYDDPHNWRVAPEGYTSFANKLREANLLTVSQYAAEKKLDASFLDNLDDEARSKIDQLSFLKIDAPSPFPRGSLAGGQEEVTVIVRDPVKRAYDEFLRGALKKEITQCIIVGAAGIGKSFNTLYLARNLMKEKKLFVFQHRGAQVLTFVPPETEVGNYTVYETPAKQFDPLEMPALKNPENFLIFDPPEKQGEAPWDVSAATVSPCSPNLAHYTQWAQQRKVDKRKLYVPAYDFTTLEICWRLGLLPNVTNIDELRSRFYYFGGSLRKIDTPDDEGLQEEKDLIGEKVIDLSPGEAANLFFARKIKEIDAEAAAAKVSSRIWAYYPSTNLRSARAGAISEFVEHLALKRHYNDLAYEAGKRKAEHGTSAASPELEKFCGMALSVLGDFETRELRKDTITTPTTTFTLKVEGPIKQVSKFANLWNNLKLAKDIDQPACLYATRKTNEPVVDFVYSADIAFQVTDAKHKIAVKSMLKILEATKAVRGEAKLHLYLVVPESEFEKAKAQTFDHPKKQENQTAAEYKKECDADEAEIKKQIVQWVLAIPATLKRQ